MFDGYELARLISGGQTGVDQAALETAIELGMACGGWCPAGRRSETGIIPLRFPLIETSSPWYPQRTRLNIRDSDSTLIISDGPIRSGTALTVQFALDLKRPYWIVDFQKDNFAQSCIHCIEWLKSVNPNVLNIAGPRASESPQIFSLTKNFLLQILKLPPDSVEIAPWPPFYTPTIPGLK